jgi:FAD:protein FMN transferase
LAPATPSARPPAPVSPETVAPAGMAQAAFRAMGTTVAVIVQRDRQGEAEQAVRQLFEEWEAALSRFRPESELSRLNARAGEPAPASPLLRRVLRTALDAARATDGLYDPTLGAQIARLGYDRSFEQIEAKADVATDLTAEIAERRGEFTTEVTEITEGSEVRVGLVGTGAPVDGGPRQGGAWREIIVDERAGTVALPAGAALDFGGIAKGMAVDAALAALAGRGFGAALVNAGGDLAVLGTPPGERQWSLAVPGRDAWWSIPLVRGALATSGIARRHWLQAGAPRHHLLDPRTGLPSSSGLWSATVAAGSCAQAEVAAKVAFLLGRHEGGAFLRRLGLAGLLVGADGFWSAEGAWPVLEMETLP